MEAFPAETYEYSLTIKTEAPPMIFPPSLSTTVKLKLCYTAPEMGLWKGPI